MILRALVDYYDRLAGESDSEIAAIGFSKQKISFEIVIKPDGTLVGIHDARVNEDGKLLSRLLVVPGQAKPSGSGLNPGFLWDNAQYMLGFKSDDPKPERTQKAFEAFRSAHLSLEDEVKDKAFTAVCEFLKQWKPKNCARHQGLDEITGSFGVFRLEGADEYVHDRAKVKVYWLQSMDGGADVPRGPSLLSGQVQPIARLHEPKIKGVRGAQTSGATLVSFNDPAYESYGKSQSYNAPIGETDAFKYCTALNQLTSDRGRQVHLADTTVVFWADRPTTFKDDMWGVFETQDAEDAATVTRLHGFFSRLRRAAQGAPFEDGEVPFYVLGLAPNAARVSVRFWREGTVGEFARQLGQHLADMELQGGPPNMPPLSLQRILDQTARERDDIQPLLAGAMLKAVLTGESYPITVINSVLRRTRIDGKTGGVDGHIRARMIKAYLVRNTRLIQLKEESLMALDTGCPHEAYHLGRLFAALERTQEDALGGDLNVTIKDRYFSSASANPVAAFPRLLRLHAHHMDKLGSDRRGLKVVRDKLVQEICDRIDPQKGFPVHLSLDEQGYFFVGYYHQRQDFFVKKSKDENENTDSSAPSAQEE